MGKWWETTGVKKKIKNQIQSTLPKLYIQLIHFYDVLKYSFALVFN